MEDDSQAFPGPREAITRISKRQKTKNGNSYWEYEDENGQRWIRSLIDKTVFDDEVDRFRFRLYEEGDDFADMYHGEMEKFSPTSQRTMKREVKKAAKADKTTAEKAATPQPPASSSHTTHHIKTGSPESSLGGCNIPVASAAIGVLRHKEGAFEHCVFLSGKTVFPSHIGLAPDNAKEWSLYTAGRAEPWPIKGPIVNLPADPQMSFFPAPEGVKSCTWKRVALDKASHGALITTGTAPFEYDAIRVAPGQILAPKGLLGRHYCPSAPGDCGGILIATHSGNAPLLVGIHGYGDNGTGTNGYHAFTPEVVKSLRDYTFPKN